MEQSFHVSTRHMLHCMIIDMQGDLTKTSENHLLNLHKWEQGLAGEQTYLILNLSKVPYINSAGIAILIRLVRFGQKGNFQTFAYGVTPHYEKLFRMVGLTEYMMIYPDEYSIIERISDLNKSVK